MLENICSILKMEKEILMSNDPKFNAARAKAENQIYELMDVLERTKNGFNATNYKMYLGSLSDSEFKKFMERLANEEWFNLMFQINLGDKNKTPDLQHMRNVAKKYDIPLEEYVAYPFKNPYDLDNPPISATKIPVVYTQIRGLSQVLSHKRAYASDRDSTNILTGQVTGSSKATTFTNQQTMALVTSNQQEVVKEMLGPRSDDEESKAKMLRQIEETGDFDINTIPIRKQDKQSLETTRIFLVAAGLKVSWGKENLSYILPVD